MPGLLRREDAAVCDVFDGISVDSVHEMVRRMDERLAPFVRWEGFEPIEWVYRIETGTTYGYVSETDWDKAFSSEPVWAETVYMLDANLPGREDDWCWLYNTGGLQALSDRVQVMFDEDADWCVFGTEADENGCL